MVIRNVIMIAEGVPNWMFDVGRSMFDVQFYVSKDC